MNRPLRRVAVFAALMFFALLANVTYFPLVRADGLVNDPANRRVRDAQFAQDRGAILVGNTPIVSSRPIKGTTSYQRVYANGPLWAPVTGYYSYEFGRTGLEQSSNAELAGTSASQFFTRLTDTLSGKQPQGASVITTLNAKAQQAAWDTLGNKQGAVVAINYHTGAILAMVSKPSYDPNKLADVDLTKASAAWSSLKDAAGAPMANRATNEIYPPGSTFKLVTAAAALENGMTPDTQVDAPARLKLPETNTYLPNEVNCGGTKLTLIRALEVSCNTAYANVGLSLGADKLRAQAEAFGFDAPLGGDFTSATSKFPASPNLPQTALSAIGQYDVAASPLQMALVAAGIANNGVVMRPYVVQQVRAPSLQVLSNTTPKELSRAMTAEHAQQEQQMMRGVVTSGTGTPAQVPGVTIGGKTGTAQTTPQRPPYAWFVGFAQQPDVAIAVFIESANIPRNDIAGGALAGPVFAAVVKALR
ncbi:MAG TPA: penicillin-binding protein 2 [Propionibacteriaceae bacterium]|nr:penicillin-binding protein 2 [Propionibacteriaceae bacterium]